MDNLTYEKSLIAKAARTHTPINGSLELLPLCNMNCEMCYVRLSRSELERKGHLRSAAEWISLVRQMQKAGTLFLLLTGGEPLLFPDFHNSSTYHRHPPDRTDRFRGTDTLPVS